MTRIHHNQAKQGGAALIIGLVLMMVMTILAISTMRTSTLELSMAGNLQYREKARQLAEAGLHAAMDQINANEFDPVATQQGIWLNGIAAGTIDASADNYQVDIVYRYTGDPPAGVSMTPGLRAHFFELRSTGVTMSRNARSVVSRGFWKLTD